MTERTCVHFAFGSCEESVIVRSVVAAVDHLCSTTDVPVALLDALAVPLAESLGALHSLGIRETEVCVDGNELGVRVELRHPVGAQVTETFGDAFDLVQSFFHVIERHSDTRIDMVAALR